jgi:hypothetical protein
MRLDRCETCKFWQPDEEINAAAGDCRRHPPRAHVSERTVFGVEVTWPTTNFDDWCGQWQVRLRRS